MRRRLLPLLLTFTAVAAPLGPLLQKYGGVWKVTRKSTPGNTEELKNQCVSAGVFYVCEQSSSGAVTGLLVLTPSSQAGHFNTQSILPDGRATGKGELTIDGNTWVFTSTWAGGGPVTRYRTTDTFVSFAKIQFTQEESTDGSHWTLKDSGEQVRVSR